MFRSWESTHFSLARGWIRCPHDSMVSSALMLWWLKEYLDERTKKVCSHISFKRRRGLEDDVKGQPSESVAIQMGQRGRETWFDFILT